MKHLITWLTLLAAISTNLAHAAEGAPKFIEYQGTVLDAAGAPLAPTTPRLYKMEFRLWSALEAGTLLWAEQQFATVSNGQFSVRLGEGRPVTTAISNKTLIAGVATLTTSVAHGYAAGQSITVALTPPDLALEGIHTVVDTPSPTTFTYAVSKPDIASAATIGTVTLNTALAAAFTGKDRFIGLTVVNPPDAPTEISPRLAMLSAPYAVIANEATSVVQVPGTYSTMLAGAIAYSTQTVSGSAAVTLSLDKRVNLVEASGAGTIATLPSSGAMKELVVIKTDDTPQFVTVAAPSGGKINVTKTKIRLKVKGESVTLQNIGGNDWWIVKDSRDTTQVGTIIAYGGANPPKGYLPCDGVSYSRTAYEDLFESIGTTWGSSQSGAMPALPPASPSTADTTRFNVPNLSGRFLRGINPGNSGADEDAGARFALYADGGRLVGSYQLDSVKRHMHTIDDPGHTHSGSVGGTGPSLPYAKFVNDGGGDTGFDRENRNGGAVNYSMSVSTKISAGTTGITSTGNMIEATPGSGVRAAAETRPDSAVVRYCIKF